MKKILKMINYTMGVNRPNWGGESARGWTSQGVKEPGEKHQRTEKSYNSILGVNSNYSMRPVASIPPNLE